MKLQESQFLVWPRARKTLNTKNVNLWYIHYIPILAKAQELKIAEANDKILMYNVEKIQPHFHYIVGDMIPPSEGSRLFLNSTLNMTPGENWYILGYIDPNSISKYFLEI